MSYQLLLTAKAFCLLALSNPMFNCFMYILAMGTNLLLDFIVHFWYFITLEDGWLEGTTEILVNFSKKHETPFIYLPCLSFWLYCIIAQKAVSAWNVGILKWQTSKDIKLSLWYGLEFIVKSKMEKQDLKAGESQWQNSNATTS